MILAAPYNLQIVRGCTWEALEFQMLNAASNPVDITGWNFAAEVRSSPGSAIVINLNATIVDAPNGVVRLPAIDDETTDTYPVGAYQWDLLGEDTSDDRQQLVKGRFNVVNKITDSA